MIKVVDSDADRVVHYRNQVNRLEVECDDLRRQLYEALKNVPETIKADEFVEDDSTFNFRLNSSLKQKFSDICKREHLTVGIALKRYMTDCVIAGVLK